MICKNCKFYDAQEPTEYFSGQYGDCDNPKFIRDNDKGPRNIEIHFADEVHLTSSYDRSCLTVGENFGCIHFKQKEL